METQKFLPTQFLQEAFEKFQQVGEGGDKKKFWEECIKNLYAMPEEEQKVQFIAMKQGTGALYESVNDVQRRLKADGIHEAISMTYIAKVYFGKSASWLSQRLNGSVVNGKVARFTDKERERFADALRDLSRRLETTAQAFV
jgi:hypothetical protein